jgi:predicted CoA-binding protein
MPQTVAVIGASANRAKFGNKAVRAFHQRGYTVWPVNPHETEIEGLRAYRSIADVPGPVDLVTFYVPPAIGLRVIADVAAQRPGEVWFNPGSESDELVTQARALGLIPILACSIVGHGMSPYGL